MQQPLDDRTARLEAFFQRSYEKTAEPAPILKARTPEDKRAVLEEIVAMARVLKSQETACAARSQDYLYDDEGLPA